MFVGNEFTDLDATFLTKEIEVSINEIQKKEKFSFKLIAC